MSINRQMDKEFVVHMYNGINIQFSSVHFSCSVVSNSLQPHESQHTRPPCPSPTPGVNSDSRPSSQWCHPTSHPLLSPSPPALNPSQHQSFPMNQLFASGGQSTGASVLASFPPKKFQGWSPSGCTGVSASASFPPKKSQGLSPSEWTGWISLQSKGL